MRGRHYIAGSWRADGALIPTINPSDLDETVGEYPQASLADAEEALVAARKALPGWARSNIQQRADMLRKVGDMLLARSTEVGTLLAREEGKTLAEGVGETIRAAQVFHYFAGETLRHPGQWHESLRAGHNVIVSYEPVGVVVAITPWNFPIAIPAWKVAAALAYGNVIILKPSEYTPGCAILLAEMLAEAGVPAGVFNLLLGDGRAIGQTLVDGADAVTFTGATPTGRRILQMAAPTMTKVQLELGGKNPFIVLDDADLDVAVEAAAQGTWGQTGQRCTGSERIIVTKGIYDAFVDRLVKTVSGYRVGHALDAATQIGPVANAAQLDKNMGFIQRAKADGAELATGGHLVEARTRGHFLAPTLFLNTDNAMELNREEVFGPVAGVIKVEDFDEAIAVARDCELALSSGIATTSLKHAERYRRESTAGLVTVNTPTAGVEYHVPFGGRAPSGFGGREQGTASAEFYTEIKTAYINHGVD
ncbi:aldehyde dehydrogenase (NAD+) [Sphingomonas laterariae]|uniref:Aldehyde dehydrogenase (NAD+) n=1 Tax=Edaphosphingomonas laterariae TaxID=861865 RepID=A0A239DGN0_9SPHN|nr:aldehyde dehydrogenase family protein [Sphingomonas laterariae]SNS30994.1 aldehyde dehydrogenase (NAD+) [Sphingomonas laterariae]